MINRVFHKLVALVRDRSAVVAIIVGFALVPLVGVAGLAVDTSRALFVKARLADALDAAGLAAGRVLGSGDPQGDAKMYFAANFAPGYMGATLKAGDPVVTPAADNQSLTIQATATVPTVFSQVLGETSLNFTDTSTILRETGSPNASMELTLVLDNTGSMRDNGKIAALRTAAAALIDILYGPKETIPNLWVSLVPYVASVDIGPQHAAWLSSLNQAQYSSAKWKGCVDARPDPYEDAQADAPPSVAKFAPFFWKADAANPWKPGDITEAQDTVNGAVAHGPNLSCGGAVQPMMADKQAILAAITTMAPWDHGGTMANLALGWGWRTLSPRWLGQWGGSTPASLPKPYGPNAQKVVVLLTDGQNQWNQSDYTAYGYLTDGRLGTTDNAQATVAINAKMTGLCTTMKNAGITIYTVVLQQNDQATQDLYRNCASTPEYAFVSPSAAQLAQEFQQIGSTLSNLRVER